MNNVQEKLFEAVKLGNISELKEAIEEGADVNSTDKYGWTPLHSAARNGHTYAIKILIEAGANVNKADKWSATPLYVAAQKGHTETVKILKKAGAKKLHLKNLLLQLKNLLY